MVNLKTDPSGLLVVIISLSGFFVCGTASAQFFERSYAVVIGINSYPEPFKALDYAVNDARSVAGYLENHGYYVTTLYDQRATRAAILDELMRVARKVTERDRVIVFFAGHGHTERFGPKERGYVIPFDGGDSPASYISMTDLMDQSQNMGAARHQLFVLDSCFGGLLGTRGENLINEGRDDYLDAVGSRVARQILTAGGPDQEVTDGGAPGNSLFTESILKGFAQADNNGDGFVSFAELELFVKNRASTSRQTPAAFTFPGHEGGEYLFQTGRARVVSTSAVEDKSIQRATGETWRLHDIKVGGGKAEECDLDVQRIWREYWDAEDPNAERDFIIDVMALEIVVLGYGCKGHLYHAELSEGYGATMVPGRYYESQTGGICRTLRVVLRVSNGTTDKSFLECKSENDDWIWDTIGTIEELGLEF